MLGVTATPDSGEPGGFVFICDKNGVGGRMVLNDIHKVGIGESVSLTFKGNTAAAMALEAFGADIELEASPALKRFEAALVDGAGPTFTLVLTPRGKPPLEMTFSRTGLGTAVKPLRNRCAW